MTDVYLLIRIDIDPTFAPTIPHLMPGRLADTVGLPLVLGDLVVGS